MRVFITVFLVFAFILVGFAGAGEMRIKAVDVQLKKYIPEQKPYSYEANLILPSWQESQRSGQTTLDGPRPTAVRETAESFHRLVGRSGNGYGWLNPLTRGVDRYIGQNYGNSGLVDFILVGFRDTDAADIGAVQIDITGTNLAGGAVRYDGVPLNLDLGGIGGRYPCVVALDLPFIGFNQYMDGDVVTIPAISHPYLITDYIGWDTGDGAVWTTPDFIMDDGWLHPEVATLTLYQENRLWNGAVAVVKDDDGLYRYCSVYETWFSDPERQNFGKQNDQYIFTATTGDPTFDWIYGWEDGNNPVQINPDVVTLPRAGVAMNNTGFGAIVGPGHLGPHGDDEPYYYQDIKITYATTTNYGVTWSAWDTVSFGDLGFPLYHNAEDGLLWIDESTPYEGPTFMGSNFDMDVIVDENNFIYVGFNSLWGRPGDEGWYPSAYYSGKFMARKRPGVVWEAARIWYPNGAFEGDEEPGSYFFDSEIDMAVDENGSVYAAWLDRRRTEVQVASYNRYSDPAGGNLLPDYITDIYASRSIDGGANWSADPINLSDTPGIDEYELNVAKSAADKDGGTVWVAYCIADLTEADPAVDFYISLPNDVWVGEGNDFNPPSAIDDGTNTPLIRDFALEQNYPNPFNPGTRIEFVAQESARAVLSVYSLDGSKVAEIFNDFAQRGQRYSVDFDGSDLAAGIYFYRLTIGQQSEVKKMALLK